MEWYNKLKAHSTILSNMASLGLLQIANYLIPLAVIPFIVRGLGVDMIGKVSYAQNIIQYFTIFITFGFEYSATKEISIHKDDKEKTKEIFWSVIIIKLLLLITSFFIFICLSLFWGKIQNDLPLYLTIFAINIGFTLFPTWFFQGIEEMKSMAIINFLIKLFGTGLSVFFINSPEDYLVYAGMPSIAYAIFGLGAFIYVIKKHNLSYANVSLKSIKEQCIISFPIFLNTFFTTFYTTANITILGFFVGDHEVGIYSGAHKIIMSILMVTSMPINIAIFPSISRKMAESKKEGLHYFITIGKYAILASLLVSVLTYIFSPILVSIFLGEAFANSIPVLKLFSCLPFLVITASLCTVQGLYGLGFQKYAPFMGLTVGIICILLNLILIPRLEIYGAATAWIIAQALEIIISGTIIFYKCRSYES
ncbi:MAG: oligosaccharide flippase family protein [Paludibacteraceae bacterium]|nr:oligosaccharide flippase family protein [Paludibacteraceae bacterium]MEE3484267.1 oligosaccharide flippase family protein [Bacteroidales bacterium]